MSQQTSLRQIGLLLQLTLIGLSFLIVSCSTKETVVNIQRAGNRKVGFMIQKISVGEQRSEDPDLRLYFNDLVTSTIKNVYGSDVQLLNIAADNLLESPDSLFLLSINEIDDIFLADLNLPADFKIPTDSFVEDGRSEEERVVLNQSRRVELTTRVLNGANLRTVTILKASAGMGTKADFENEFQAKFKENALQVFPNPNVYPKSDPLYFANLLFQFSERRERETLDSLSCENASDVLSGYAQARDLYQKAKTKGVDDPVGQQVQAHEINTKLEEATRKADILKKCEEDKTRGFAFDYEFLGIDVSNQNLIKQAMQKSKLEELLKQYTDKPVTFSYALEATGTLSLQVFLRFDKRKFLGWTKKTKVPETVANHHILSLEPYYPLLQTLVYLRTALPKEAPQVLQIPFAKMEMTVVLQTLLNGEVYIGANGKIAPETNAIQIFYPNSLIVKIPSYERATVITRSEDIFQEKGWIALSSCKTVDGTLTEDGLVMQFFGLPCKI